MCLNPANEGNFSIWNPDASKLFSGKATFNKKFPDIWRRNWKFFERSQNIPAYLHSAWTSIRRRAQIDLVWKVSYYYNFIVNR